MHGNRFFQASVRGKEEHRGVYPAVAPVTGLKGEKNSESHVMMDNLTKLAAYAPAIVGPNTDGVSRGVCVDDFQRKLGWVPVSPSVAKEANGKTKSRTMKQDFLRSVAFEGCDGEEVDVWHHGGALVKAGFDDEGEPVFESLRWLRVTRRANTDRTWRIYVEYEATCSCGLHAKTILERTTNDEDDKSRGFNRAENIRAVSEASDMYKKIYGRRSDAESRNRRIDDGLYLRRARSLGSERQLLDLIGHADAVNSVSLSRWSVADTERAIAS